jgi:hypothetical protein
LQEPIELDFNKPAYQPHEAVYYQDGTGLTVTSSRVIFGSKTFFLPNLTSLRVAELPAPKFYPSILMAIGVIIFFSAIGQINSNPPSALAGIGLSLPFIIGSIIWFTLQKPNYCIKLGSFAGEMDLVTSDDRDYLLTIAGAINQAVPGKYSQV